MEEEEEEKALVQAGLAMPQSKLTQGPHTGGLFAYYRLESSRVTTIKATISTTSTTATPTTTMTTIQTMPTTPTKATSTETSSRFSTKKYQASADLA